MRNKIKIKVTIKILILILIKIIIIFLIVVYCIMFYYVLACFPCVPHTPHALASSCALSLAVPSQDNMRFSLAHVFVCVLVC